MPELDLAPDREWKCPETYSGKVEIRASAM
jgi:hypothetical protein